MNEKMKLFQEEFDALITESKRFCFLCRAKEFQLEKYEALKALKDKAATLKSEMIEGSDEDSANKMLCFEDIIDTFMNELRMWIALKDNCPGPAWDFLVDAQGAIRHALQAHSTANLLEDHAEHLHNLEKLLFPPMLFFSPGLIIKNSECSICGKEYGECNHIKLRAYMGKHCCRIIKDCYAVEVSIVDEPANKHCRIINLTENGIERDVLTWRPIKQ